jgi:tetraacyldisaccharide 4'-kinase
MFPHGKLREPFSALRRADAAILTSGCDRPPRQAEEFLNTVPVFRSQIIPVTVNFGVTSVRAAEWHPETDVILASGIANPSGFRKTVEDLGITVVRHSMFPDHHVFRDPELHELISEAEERMLLVTEKDWVKLPEWFKQKPNTAALRIGIAIDREQDLIDLIKHTINRG